MKHFVLALVLAATASNAEINKVIKEIKAMPAHVDRSVVVVEAASARDITSAQAVKLLRLVPKNSTGRLDAAVALRERVVDPENYFKVYALFPDAADQKALRKGIKTVRVNDGGLVSVDVVDKAQKRVAKAKIYFCGQGPLSPPVETTVTEGQWLERGCEMQVWVDGSMIDSEFFTPHIDHPFERVIRLGAPASTPAPGPAPVRTPTPAPSINIHLGTSPNVRTPLGYAQELRSCSWFRHGDKSCFMEFKGFDREVCEVCREEKSCFMAVGRGIERELCEAYVESKSCFMAVKNKTDRGWCEHLKEGKSCFMALNGAEREACEDRRIPLRHLRWLQ